MGLLLLRAEDPVQDGSSERTAAGGRSTTMLMLTQTHACIIFLGPAPEGSIENSQKTELKNKNHFIYLANSCMSPKLSKDKDEKNNGRGIISCTKLHRL